MHIISERLTGGERDEVNQFYGEELRTNSTLVAWYLGWDVGGSVGESRLKRLEQILKSLSCHTVYASFLTFQFDNVLYIHWANSLRRKNKQAEGRWNVKKMPNDLRTKPAKKTRRGFCKQFIESKGPGEGRRLLRYDSTHLILFQRERTIGPAHP